MYDLAVTPMTIGRDSANAIVLDEVGVSRWHAVIEQAPDGDGLVLRDMGSKNGTFIDGEAHPRHALTDGVVVGVGVASLKFWPRATPSRAITSPVARAAIEDALTGLPNRRHFQSYVQREVARAQRHGSPLALLMIDIDHFKAINDTHGHLTGDTVLTELGAFLRNGVRSSELMARFGGEEFVAVLPETGLSGATTLAERLRAGVEGLPITGVGPDIRLTVQHRGAVWHPEMDEADLVEAADKAMYAAKMAGRNRVMFATPSP